MRVATRDCTAKLTPAPSKVAPRGNARPGQTSRMAGPHFDERHGQRGEYVHQIQTASVARGREHAVREDLAKLVAIELGGKLQERVAPVVSDGRVGAIAESHEKSAGGRDDRFVAPDARERH